MEDVDKYRFLNNGYINLPNVDDANEFHNTVRSMKIMGFQEEEITCKMFYEKVQLMYSRCSAYFVQLSKT